MTFPLKRAIKKNKVVSTVDTQLDLLQQKLPDKIIFTKGN
jgi:hypothetical protein